MALWLGIIIAVVAFLVWFYTLGKGPPRGLDSPGALFRAVKSLHDLGMEGAVVRIEVRDDPSHYVAVTKRVRALGSVELVGELPGSDLTAQQYEAVHQEVVSRGLVVLDGRPDLRVRLGTNLNDAEAFVTIAMETAFGVTVSSDCVAYAKKILIWNKPGLTGVPNS